MSEQASRALPRTRSSPVLMGWLLAGQWRAQPGRLATAVLAIAIGVALSLAIELVNRSALSVAEHSFERTVITIHRGCFVISSASARCDAI